MSRRDTDRITDVMAVNRHFTALISIPPHIIRLYPDADNSLITAMCDVSYFIISASVITANCN